MAEAENRMNEQPGTEPEEIMDETAEEITDETAEETTDETAEETMDETGTEEAAEETPDAESNAEESAEEPEPQAPAGSREKALQDKVAALEDKVKRQMAEFDNFRKRTDKEKDQMFSMGEKNVLEKLLPIIDNFERGFDSVQPEDEEDAFVQGMRKIYAQLVKQMEDIGVTPIDAAGKEFDPNLHNAVMQVESEEYPSGTVAQELLKGYMFHDTVLRHSMVSVVS